MPNNYGGEHQRLRKYWAGIITAGNNPPCSRCGYPVLASDKWDLDHTDDGRGWLGPAHRACNRRVAAVKKNRMYATRNPRRLRKQPATRNW